MAEISKILSEKRFSFIGMAGIAFFGGIAATLFEGHVDIGPQTKSSVCDGQYRELVRHKVHPAGGKVRGNRSTCTLAFGGAAGQATMSWKHGEMNKMLADPAQILAMQKQVNAARALAASGASAPASAP